MFIEIGPGKNPVNKDWFIIDVVKYPYVDLVYDIRQLPIPLSEGVAEQIYMSHILEHVPWFQTIDVLKELHRILEPGGCLEVWVPDFRKLVHAYLNKDTGLDKWRKYNPTDDPMVWLNGRLFTYGPGEENWHKAVFDEEYLRQCFKEAGFIRIHKLSKPQGRDLHGWINLGVAGYK